MITGEKQQETCWERIAKALLMRAMLSPLTLMGAGLTFVGVLSLGPRKDIPELWICLPAGLVLLLVLQGILWWASIWLPRHTILRFVLEGADLTLQTRAHGSFTCSLEDMKEISATRNRRGQIRGWWIHCPVQGWVFMDSQTPNSKTLLDKLTELPAPPPC